VLSLLGGFLDVQNGAALVCAALGASAVGQLLFVAVGALRDARGRQKVVGAAIGCAARRVAPFRIRHGAIPFVFRPLLFVRPQASFTSLAAGAEHPQSLGVILAT